MRPTSGKFLHFFILIPLLIVLPLFVWAVMTQRIELRKQAATNKATTARRNPTTPPTHLQSAVQNRQMEASGSSRLDSPTSSPMSQTLRFRVKLRGVDGDEADGTTMMVKFERKNDSTVQLPQPLTLKHVGSGIYEASAVLTNPLQTGTAFKLALKGERHTTAKFCRQTGQAGPCDKDEYITVPDPIPSSYWFDLTAMPLSPGDVYKENGKTDAIKIKQAMALMNKPCSSLTPEEKMEADLDYNGCINVRDVFLMQQTIATTLLQ